jgi:2-phosphosulfolactate phosphatase
MTPFSQEAWACRCEWGPGAVAALAPADVTIVVDVFSFTTCVDVAASHGASTLPYPWNDAFAAEFARAQRAELAGRRRQARYSLAPASDLEAPEGLRCVLPSPNGAQVTLAAARTAAVLLAGSLRNARAAAEAAEQLGSSFNGRADQTVLRRQPASDRSPADIPHKAPAIAGRVGNARTAISVATTI